MPKHYLLDSFNINTAETKPFFLVNACLVQQLPRAEPKTAKIMSTTLVDLPLDILLLIVPYLDVPSFTALTATCKALHNPDFAQDSSYWSSTTRSTFRVPNQPVVENDGKRWQRLYKRLLTQSRVYTWGNNEKACLGHSYQSPAALGRMPPHMRRRVAMRGRHVSWPTEMEEVQDLGIIADMQCGSVTAHYTLVVPELG